VPAQLCDRCYSRGVLPNSISTDAAGDSSSMMEIVRRATPRFNEWWEKHRKEGLPVRFVHPPDTCSMTTMVCFHSSP